MVKRVKVVAALAATSAFFAADAMCDDTIPELPPVLIEGQSMCTRNPWLEQCGGSGVNTGGEADVEAMTALYSFMIVSLPTVKKLADNYQAKCINAEEPSAVYIQRQILECKSWVLDTVGFPLNWFDAVKAAALAGCQTHTTEFALIAMERTKVCGK